MSKQHPEEFLNYLQQAWKRDKIYAKENPDSMFDIKAIRVLCQDGKFRPLGNSYIPLPKLHYLRNRYMLEGEPFPFLRLDPPIRSEGGFGQWRCLRAFAKYHDDLDFFLEMLVRIRRTKASTVEFPRRILELYLRIQAECEDSKDPAASQQKVRNTFEKEQLVYVHPIWRPLSECLLEDTCEISSTLSKSPVFPVPSDWDASKSELVSLREFYTQTLRLQNASYRTIVDVLEKRDFDAELDPADLWLTDELYRALDKMRLDLSPDDAADLKLAFAEKAIIAIAPGEAVTWLNAADCTWSPKLESPEINDLSRHYPELHDFFVNFLDVKQNDSGLIFDTLMNVSSLSPDCSRDNTARGLLVAVSQRIPEFGHIFDKERFARSNVFPVSTADGVLLCASTMEFSVADRQNLKEAFTGKLNLLDFDPKTVWMLDNLLVWAGLDSRYLSRHVEDQGPADENFKSIELPYELSSKADQLLRIAVHFKSPRTSTPKATSWLRETLEHSEVRLASGFQSQLIYRSGSAFITAVNPMGGLDIKDTVGFTVYADDENWEILKQTVLPRRLLEWIMTDPETNVTGPVPEQAVSLILDAEGIVDLELLEASPYWRVNSERVPDTTITTKSDKLRPAKTLDDEDEPSPAYTQGESYHAREDLADSKGSPTHDFNTAEPGLTTKINSAERGMTTKAGDLTKDTKQDALRDRLPISKRGLERRHSEKQTWEEEFVANEATLIDFSGEDSNSTTVTMMLHSRPDSAKRFQGEMDRYKQSAEYQHPVMKKVISTLKENFDKAAKDMSVLLANNLASFVRYELTDLSSSVVAHITLCSVYNMVLSLFWEVEFPADKIIYPSNKSEEEQEILFIASSLDDRVEPEDEQSDSDDLSELIEEGIQTIREMTKSLKAEKEQTELSREEAELEIASYELATHGVNSNHSTVEDEDVSRQDKQRCRLMI
ncbi:hypothetical protein FOXB_12351 [Fusarium oxysporum f. sp. conglutinans Fo5176]|uniref:Uncharacterized protein n=3 Tax=Fusarium oxysporum TaxID=5507 RepID=F9G119_FUSOF|nr:hypothetical protein FOXB_12351 [Fusarium oxysporum f. sp. conglutinans Fo5176]